VKRFSRLLWTAFLAFSFSPSVPKANAPATLFTSDAVVRLRLDAPYSDLISAGRHAKDDEGVSVAGVLSYIDPTTTREVSLGRVKVSLRGNTSRRDEECTFPKLKVDLPKDASLRGTAFAGLSSLKIGTHCGDRPDGQLTKLGRWANEKSPYREAFVYQLLNAVDIPTLKARPAQITYVDTGSDAGRRTVRHAMLLEDDAAAIERLGGLGQLQTFDNARKDFPIDAIADATFAEAMIGNFDWAVKMTPDDYYRIDHTHPLWNVLAVRRNDGTAFPLIYDFDVSGIVAGKHLWFSKVYDARFLPSASPPAIEVLAQVQRTRMLFPRSDLDRARARFMRSKDAAYAALERATIDPEGRENARAYLDSFFNAIADDKAFYLPVVANDNALPYVSPEGDRDVCGDAERIPVGTVVSEPRERRNGRVRVSLLDVSWHFALRCAAMREGPVWLDERAIGGDHQR